MERQGSPVWGRRQVSERPDHALWWRRDISLHWRAQDVRVVREALLMGRRRRPDEIGHHTAGLTNLTVDNARDAVPACMMHLLESTAAYAWQSDMQ